RAAQGRAAGKPARQQAEAVFSYCGYYNCRMLRMLVALMLALALPLQGIAAVKACFCATQDAHHPETGAGHHDVGHGDHHQHEDTNAPAQSHCGPCAACCVPAAVGEVAIPIYVEATFSPVIPSARQL